MQNKETKKTKLVPKSLLWVGPLVVFALLILTVGVLHNNKYKLVTINNRQLQLEKVSKQKDLEKGLSGKNSLPQQAGMLFDFGSMGDWKIWMKDMKFPIDILWLDDKGKVVYIKQNALPESYPEIFSTDSKSRYVIELSHGSASRLNIDNDTQIYIK